VNRLKPSLTAILAALAGSALIVLGVAVGEAGAAIWKPGVQA